MITGASSHGTGWSFALFWQQLKTCGLKCWQEVFTPLVGREEPTTQSVSVVGSVTCGPESSFRKGGYNLHHLALLLAECNCPVVFLCCSDHPLQTAHALLVSIFSVEISLPGCLRCKLGQDRQDDLASGGSEEGDLKHGKPSSRCCLHDPDIHLLGYWEGMF